jgi:dehydrogenase/reductase SDR family protein 7B
LYNTNVSKNALTVDGTPQGKMDLAEGNGMIPECCAKRILKAIKNKKEAVYIAGAKEKLDVYLKQFFLKLFSVLVQKISVT